MSGHRQSQNIFTSSLAQVELNQLAATNNVRNVRHITTIYHCYQRGNETNSALIDILLIQSVHNGI